MAYFIKCPIEMYKTFKNNPINIEKVWSMEPLKNNDDYFIRFFFDGGHKDWYLPRRIRDDIFKKLCDNHFDQIRFTYVDDYCSRCWELKKNCGCHITKPTPYYNKLRISPGRKS